MAGPFPVTCMVVDVGDKQPRVSGAKTNPEHQSISIVHHPRSGLHKQSRKNRPADTPEAKKFYMWREVLTVVRVRFAGPFSHLPFAPYPMAVALSCEPVMRPRLLPPLSFALSPQYFLGIWEKIPRT